METSIDHTNNLGNLCTSEQCAQGLGGKPAIRMISTNGVDAQTLTYEQLDALSNIDANIFQGLGLSAGNQVFIYLPRLLDYYPLFLGALKANLVVCPLFSNFGPDALADRISGTEPKVIVTKGSLYNRIQKILPRISNLHAVILIDEAEKDNPILQSLKTLRASVSTIFAVSSTELNTPSILHYTSGSTGKPKGVQHVHGAAQGIVDSFMEIMQPLPDDLYWCTADPGWVTGTSYGILAPLLSGLTLLQFEGGFDPEIWFKIIENNSVNILYTAPTVLRMMMQNDSIDYKKFDLSSLRNIYSVGEPLNPEIYHWGLKNLGREIHDTWFQTETGSIIIANRPGLQIKPGSMGKPRAGLYPEILDNDDNPAETDQVGKLVLRTPWESMFVDYVGNTESYRSKFRKGYYVTGDLAKKDSDGYFWFIGRDDDVINTSGHLVSPFEVESSLLELPEIVDVGVIGAPDPLLWEKVVAFVKLAHDTEWTKRLGLKFKLHVSNRLSSVAVPADIVIVDSIPKNRSGKIMRRVLRALYAGTDPGDLSTLEE
jgi:acetyl-CoA synthetase